MTIHHEHTASDSPPIFSDVVRALVHVIRWRPAAQASHSAGAGAIISSAVGLIEPVVTTTSAASAAWRQRDCVAAAATSPISQPSPAQGSNSAEVRETYGRMNGVSW